MVKMSSDTLRLAIILGVVLPGVGHIYLGQIKRGIKVVLLLIFSGSISGFLQTFFPPIISPIVSFIPLIVWIWQIKDLRRIIKKLTGRSVEELEPPHLEIDPINPTDGNICQECGKRVNKESSVCDNCGLKL